MLQLRCFLFICRHVASMKVPAAMLAIVLVLLVQAE